MLEVRIGVGLVVAIVFGACVERPPCSQLTLAKIQAECTAEEYKRGCADDPDGKCPDVVQACREKILEWHACE